MASCTQDSSRKEKKKKKQTLSSAQLLKLTVQGSDLGTRARPCPGARQVPFGMCYLQAQGQLEGQGCSEAAIC